MQVVMDELSAISPSDLIVGVPRPARRSELAVEANRAALHLRIKSGVGVGLKIPSLVHQSKVQAVGEWPTWWQNRDVERRLHRRGNVGVGVEDSDEGAAECGGLVRRGDVSP